MFQPDVAVKGSTTGGDYPESKVVEECGGEFVVIPAQEDISTTKLVEKITNGS